MQRFFDRPDTRWRRLEGALHFYLLPHRDDSALSTHDEAVGRLGDLPGVAIQPGPYLHVTLQRLDAYEDELGAPRWEGLLSDLGARLAGLDPFVLRFAAPAVRERAVEVLGTEDASWRRLVGTLRTALCEHGLEDVLTAPPFGPHYTLAYCTAPVEDEDVRRALGPARTTEITVDEVALVAVDQHPETGVFTFATRRSWTLGHTMTAS